MALHYYVQSRDIDNLISGWKQNTHFQEYVRNFPDNPSYNCDQLANEFLARVKGRHDKHFEQWRSKYLHLMLAGDPLPARYIAQWIVYGTVNRIALPPPYMSNKHKTVIDIRLMLDFLTAHNTPADQCAKEYYQQHS